MVNAPRALRGLLHLLIQLLAMLKSPQMWNRSDSFMQVLETNQDRYPILPKMAHDILTIPLSIVASESPLSVGGRVLDAFRSSLNPDIMEAVICLRDWLFGKALMPPQVNLDDVCGNVMKMNLNDNKDGEDQLKSAAGSGFSRNLALVN